MQSPKEVRAQQVTKQERSMRQDLQVQRPWGWEEGGGRSSRSECGRRGACIPGRSRHSLLGDPGAERRGHHRSLAALCRAH